jgi:hypothetical protein
MSFVTQWPGQKLPLSPRPKYIIILALVKPAIRIFEPVPSGGSGMWKFRQFVDAVNDRNSLSGMYIGNTAKTY